MEMSQKGPHSRNSSMTSAPLILLALETLLTCSLEQSRSSSWTLWGPHQDLDDGRDRQSARHKLDDRTNLQSAQRSTSLDIWLRCEHEQIGNMYKIRDSKQGISAAG